MLLFFVMVVILLFIKSVMVCCLFWRDNGCVVSVSFVGEGCW